MQKRMITVALAALAVVVLATSVTEAGCFRRRAYCCQPVYVAAVKPHACRTFQFKPFVDFTIVSGSRDTTIVGNSDKYAIEIQGKPADVALLKGEKVRLSLVCKVRLDQAYLDGLDQAGSGLTLIKPLTGIVVESTLNEKGVAVFEREVILKAVAKKLKNIRFWDHPVLFGIEEFDISVCGVAKVGCKTYKCTKGMVLEGKVTEMITE